MSDTPMSCGRPQGGRDEPSQDVDQLPGERPLGEDEQAVGSPGQPEQPSGHSTRAAGEPMPGDQGNDVVMGGGPGGSASRTGMGTPETAGAEQERRARGE